jgi:hypothetical protein
MRRAWAATLAAAALAETLAYFLSLTWGFMALLLAFVVVSTRMASTAAKAYSTEARVAAIMPVLATHAANITTAQNTANNAQGTANTANNTANNAQGTANAANSTANNALPSSGGTVNGGLNVTGGVTIGGNLWGASGTLTVGSTTVFDQTVTVDGAAGFHAGVVVDDAITVGSLNVNGAGLSIPQGDLSLATTPPNGSSSASQYCGSFYTGSGAANWASDVTNAVNACIGTLRDLGLI